MSFQLFGSLRTLRLLHFKTFSTYLGRALATSMSTSCKVVHARSNMLCFNTASLRANIHRLENADSVYTICVLFLFTVCHSKPLSQHSTRLSTSANNYLLASLAY